MDSEIRKDNRIPGSCDGFTRPEEISALNKYLGDIREAQEAHTTLISDNIGVNKAEMKNVKELPDSLEVLTRKGEVSKLVSEKDWLDSGKDLTVLERNKTERLKGKETRELGKEVDTINVDKNNILSNSVDKLGQQKNIGELESDLQRINTGKTVSSLNNYADKLGGSSKNNSLDKNKEQLPRSERVSASKNDISAIDKTQELSGKSVSLGKIKGSELDDRLERINVEKENKLSENIERILNSRKDQILSNTLETISENQQTSLDKTLETITDDRKINLGSDIEKINNTKETKLDNRISKLGYKENSQLSTSREDITDRRKTSLDNHLENISNAGNSIELSDKIETLDENQEVKLSNKISKLRDKKENELSTEIDKLTSTEKVYSLSKNLSRIEFPNNINSLDNFIESLEIKDKTELSNTREDLKHNSEIEHLKENRINLTDNKEIKLEDNIETLKNHNEAVLSDKVDKIKITEIDSLNKTSYKLEDNSDVILSKQLDLLLGKEINKLPDNLEEIIDDRIITLNKLSEKLQKTEDNINLGTELINIDNVNNNVESLKSELTEKITVNEINELPHSNIEHLENNNDSITTLEEGSEKLEYNVTENFTNLPHNKETLEINHLDNILNDHLETIQDNRDDLNLSNTKSDLININTNEVSLSIHTENIQNNDDIELGTHREEININQDSELSDKIEKIEVNLDDKLSDNVEILEINSDNSLNSYIEKLENIDENNTISTHIENIEILSDSKLSNHREDIEISDESNLSEHREDIEISDNNELGNYVENIEISNNSELSKHIEKIDHQDDNNLSETLLKINDNLDEDLSNHIEKIEDNREDNLSEVLLKLEDNREVSLSDVLKTIEDELDEELSEKRVDIEKPEDNNLSETLLKINDNLDEDLSNHIEKIEDNREDNLSEVLLKLEDNREVSLSDVLKTIEDELDEELSEKRVDIEKPEDGDLSDKLLKLPKLAKYLILRLLELQKVNSLHKKSRVDLLENNSTNYFDNLDDTEGKGELSSFLEKIEDDLDEELYEEDSRINIDIEKLQEELEKLNSIESYKDLEKFNEDRGWKKLAVNLIKALKFYKEYKNIKLNPSDTSKENANGSNILDPDQNFEKYSELKDFQTDRADKAENKNENAWNDELNDELYDSRLSAPEHNNLKSNRRDLIKDSDNYDSLLKTADFDTDGNKDLPDNDPDHNEYYFDNLDDTEGKGELSKQLNKILVTDNTKSDYEKSKTKRKKVTPNEHTDWIKDLDDTDRNALTNAIKNRDNTEKYYNYVLNFAQSKNLNKGWASKVQSLMSTYLSGDMDASKMDEFLGKLYETYINGGVVKEMLAVSKGEKTMEQAWDDVGLYRTPNSKLPLNPLSTAVLNPTTYIRFIAESTGNLVTNDSWHKGSISGLRSGAKQLMIDASLWALIMARRAMEVATKANRDRLPGADTGLLQNILQGSNDSLLETGAKAVVSSVTNAINGTRDIDTSKPMNRPELDGVGGNMGNIASSVLGTETKLKKTEGWETVNNRPTQSLSSPVAPASKEKGFKAALKNLGSGIAQAVVGKQGEKNYKFSDQYMQGLGIYTTLAELTNKKPTDIKSVEDLEEALKTSELITTAGKVTSTKGDYKSFTLDNNSYWEIIFEPFVGDINGNVSYLPSIHEINIINAIQHGVNTAYNRWIPFTSFELSKSKLNTKQLSLYEGEISYPVSMDFINELRLSILDDSYKSWRRYFEKCAEVAVYNSNPHEPKFYGYNNNMQNWSGYPENPILTTIDKTHVIISSYKNITFRCRIYSMTPQFSTINKYDLLVVLKDFNEERSGDIEPSSSDLNLTFSIVGENPMPKPEKSKQSGNFFLRLTNKIIQEHEEIKSVNIFSASTKPTNTSGILS